MMHCYEESITLLGQVIGSDVVRPLPIHECLDMKKIISFCQSYNDRVLWVCSIGHHSTAFDFRIGYPRTGPEVDPRLSSPHHPKLYTLSMRGHISPSKIRTLAFFNRRVPYILTPPAQRTRNLFCSPHKTHSDAFGVSELSEFHSSSG